MHPVLFEIFGKEIHFYQVALPSAILLGIFLCSRRVRVEGLSEEAFLGAALAAIFGVLIGGRLLDVIVRWDYYSVDLARIFTNRAGAVFYGGYIGALLGAFGYLKIKKQPYLAHQDVACTYFGLGLAVHRTFGCFMAGCCFGGPTNLPWGVTFPEGSRAWKAFDGHAVHPSQLYEALLGLLIFATVITYRNKRGNSRVYGELFAVQLYMYGIGRFLLEFLRGDGSRGQFGVFSTSQWISIVMVLMAGAINVYTYRMKQLVSQGKLSPVGVMEPPPLTGASSSKSGSGRSGSGKAAKKSGGKKSSKGKSK
ncbi:MAG: prolipoprotein diacylglyceryl transferase [Deltaproteobacteria bacterium]|nr:prolipoprotein diacylglyceryl transferase [bacterium]MCB9487581.1 prolipoprotein diacylglyceryl transferase [Deltaproteobacteria bacterium]